MSKDINLIVNEMLGFSKILEYIDDNVKINGKNSKKEEILPAYKKFPEVVFDSDSYNFHVFPKNKEQYNRLADEFNELRLRIKEVLKAKCRIENKIYFLQHKNSDIGILNIRKGGGNFRSFINVEDKKQVPIKDRLSEKNIYRFVEVCYNDAYYTINFMRYTCAKGKVGCTMRAIQFHKSTFNKGFNLNQSKDKRFEICYPLNADDNSKNTIPKQSENIVDKFTSVCYNPPVEWPNEASLGEPVNWNDETIEKIVTRFSYFIKHEGNILMLQDENEYEKFRKQSN